MRRSELAAADSCRRDIPAQIGGVAPPSDTDHLPPDSLLLSQPPAALAVCGDRAGDLSPLGLRLCCLVLAGRCAAAAASAGSGLVGQR